MSSATAVLVIAISNVEGEVLKSVLAGIEEESVLYRIHRVQEDTDSITLAYQASRQSTLGVGIGLNRNNGHLAIREQLAPVIVQGDFSMRELGHNSARYVKGRPLKGCDL